MNSSREITPTALLELLQQSPETVLLDVRKNHDFAADPERYAPQYGGYCAYAASYNALADVDLVREELLRLLVHDVDDAHHEAAAADVADDVEIEQGPELFFKIGADFLDVLEQVFALHDLDVLERGGT